MPSHKSPGKPPNPVAIMRRLEVKGISVRTAAARLGVNRAHLTRVLTGQRPGSRVLLESVSELAETMPGRRPQHDVARLIGAAVHMFFVKRGKFQSEIWTGAGPRKATEEAA